MHTHGFKNKLSIGAEQLTKREETDRRATTQKDNQTTRHTEKYIDDQTKKETDIKTKQNLQYYTITILYLKKK